MRSQSNVAVSVFVFALFAFQAAGQGPLDFLKSEKGSKYGLDPVAPGEILGVVVDADDKGVAGATVYLRIYAEWNMRYNNGSLRETKTDSRGQFVFHDLKAGNYQLAAVSGGFATRTERRRWHNIKDFEVAINRDPVVMTLKPEPMRQVHFRVVDAATKKPIGGATVQADWSMDLKRFWTADDKGHVHMQGVLPRAYEFRAYAPGYAKSDDVGFDLKSAGDVDTTVELGPAAVVTGIVRDEQGGPLSTARLTVRDPENSSYYIDSARCNSQGVYRLNHLPSDKALILDFSCDGYREQRLTGKLFKPGVVSNFDVTMNKLPYGGSVQGIVVNAAGEPIAGAEVLQWGRSSNEKRTTVTDAGGRFSMDDLYHRRRGPELGVKAAGYASTMVPIKPGTREKPAEVRIELAAGGKVRGRVVNEAGEPLRGVRIQFGRQVFGVGDDKRTGPDGRFNFDTLPENVKLDIRADGYSRRKVADFKVNREEVIDFVLRPIGFVRGLVVDAKTKSPITKFNVRLGFTPDYVKGDPSHGIGRHFDGENHASPDGRFDINEYAVGHPFLVRVAAEGYRPVTIRRLLAVRPDDDERATFELQPIEADMLRAIAGSIVDSEGKPIRHVQVRLLASVNGKDSHGQAFQWYAIRGNDAGNTDDQLLQSMLATTDEQGRFRFEDVYGDLVLELAYWGADVAPGRLKGIEKRSAEEQQALRITTAAAATLTVTLSSKDLANADSVRLTPTTNRDDWSSNLNAYRPDGEGRWTIADIAPGEYRLTVTRSERINPTENAYRSVRLHQQTITLAAGERKELDVEEARLSTPAASLSSRLLKAAAELSEALSNAAEKAKSEPGEK